MSLRMALGAFIETDLASAATCDLGSIQTMWARITGTTTITSFGTRQNCWRYVRFAGALTLTHNATSLILPGGANIATGAGDTLFAKSDGSGNWRVQRYTRADGTIVLSGGQIAFPATQNASSDPNTLDDYEEGTWTPTLTFGTPPTGLTHGTQSGRYTKIGRLVFVKFQCSLTSKGTGGSGSNSITGLPFVNGGESANLTLLWNLINMTGYTALVGFVNTGVSTVAAWKMGVNNAPAIVPWSEFADTSYVFGSGVYSV